MSLKKIFLTSENELGWGGNKTCWVATTISRKGKIWVSQTVQVKKRNYVESCLGDRIELSDRLEYDSKVVKDHTTSQNSELGDWMDALC